MNQSLRALANSTRNRLKRVKVLSITLQSDPRRPAPDLEEFWRAVIPQLETLTIQGGAWISSGLPDIDSALFSQHLIVPPSRRIDNFSPSYSLAGTS